MLFKQLRIKKKYVLEKMTTVEVYFAAWTLLPGLKGLHKSLLCTQRGIFTGFVFKLTPVFFFLFRNNILQLGLICEEDPHLS